MKFDFYKRLLAVFVLSFLVVGCSGVVDIEEPEDEDLIQDIPEDSHYEVDDIEDSEARELDNAIADISDEDDLGIEDLGLDIFE